MPRVVRVPGLKEPLTFPSGTSDVDIYTAIADKLFPLPEVPEAPKEPPSFFEVFKEGVTTLGDVPEALRYLYAPGAETRKEAAETTKSPYEYQGVTDIESVGDLGRFIKEQTGQAIGFITPAAAASATAARVTPGPAPVKAAAGVGAFLTTAGAQYMANTTGRQAAEQEKRVAEGKPPEMPDITKILLTSAGQAGLDIAGFRFFKPLSNLIGLGGRDAVKETAEELAKIAAREGPEKAASILAGTGKGVLFESAQETVQALLERTGAGLDLSSDEAIREYFESAVAGGILGGALGAGTTAVQKVGTKTKDELSRLALEAREAKDPKKLWKDAKKDILKETQPLSLLDAQGNPLPVTREFLTSLGVNPEAKALAGVPMESILNQPATDGGVAQTLVKYFTDKIQDINTTLERKDLTDERRSELTSTYESLSTGLKTFTQRATEAKKEKERAEREAQTIPVFKLPEGFEFKKKNDKALAGELIDPQGRSRGKFASIEEAGLFANTLYKPATPITPTAPAAPEPTFEAPTPEPVETVDVTADRLAGEPVVEAAPEARIEPTLGEAPVAAPAPTVTPEPTLEAAPAPTVTPEPTPTPTAEAAPIPEPAPQVAEQIQALRDDYGMDGLASAISSRPAAEQVQLTQQVSDTLAQIDQLETNRKALRAQNDQASIKAVGEQIRKLENSLDDLEYTLTNVPNTRAEVQAVVKASGNAAEANKIAADINKENGCK